MALSAKDQAELERLQRKAKEPDRGKNASYVVHVHTNEEEGRSIAERLGLLGEREEEPEPDDTDDTDDDEGEPPRRGGYFSS